MSAPPENQTGFPAPISARSPRGRALLLLGFCLVVGLGVVAWRAKGRVGAARSTARTEARTSAALLELQFSRVASAAELVGMLTRQARGGLTNFQKIAVELLSTHLEVAYLRLEPGGVVSDVAPRIGHERTLGVNVLRDPAQRDAANEALNRRTLTLAIPVTLDSGEQGLVARVPILQKSPDGRESLWGFVAVFARLQNIFDRAHLAELSRRGYSYSLFASPPGRQKVQVVASHTLSPTQDAVQQPMPIQNLELSLALKPLGGWIDKGRLTLEFVVVLLISLIASFAENLREHHRAAETELTEANRRLLRESSERKQERENSRTAHERLTALQAELKQSRSVLEQTRSNAAQVQLRLEATEQDRDKTAKAHQTELTQAHVALEKAQDTLQELRSQLEASVAEQKRTTAAEMELARQHETETTDLQAKLHAAKSSFQQTVKAGEAKLLQLEQSNRELKLAGEQAQARVAELTAILEQTREELRPHQESSIQNVAASPTFNASHDSAMPVESSEPVAEVVELKTGLSPLSDQLDPLPRPSTTEAPEKAFKPPATHKTRVPKPKRAHRDSQLHLFGSDSVPPRDQQTVAPAKDQTELQTTGSTTGPSQKPSSGHQTSKTSYSKPGSSTKPEVSDPDIQQSSPKPVTPRRLPPSPPVDPTQLRKAANQILPLLTERDPGAVDCLKDNRKTFRSAFTTESYEEFEHLVRGGEFDHALEQLRKVARKHGIDI